MSSAPRYLQTVSSAWTAPIGYHRTVNEPEKNAADEAQRFPYWQRNLRVIPLANVLCGMGFTIVYPFLPMLVRRALPSAPGSYSTTLLASCKTAPAIRKSRLILVP